MLPHGEEAALAAPNEEDLVGKFVVIKPKLFLV
jgi:hypothetical protein